MADIKYFIDYAEKLAADAGDSFAEQRAAGRAALAAAGFPTLKTEGWRKTDLSPILTTDFAPALSQGAHTERAWWRDSLDACRMITFANGAWNRTCSNLTDLPAGLEIMSLEEAAKANGTLKVFGQIAKAEQNAFTALNTASFRDGLVIKVKANTILEQPIHVFHQTHAPESAVHAHPRLLVIAEPNSAVQIVESYSGAGGNSYFVNSVAEFVVGANAQIDHIRLQDDAQNAVHVGGTWIKQDRDSRFSTTALNLGGRLSRNDIVVDLQGEGADCSLFGLYLGVGEQVHDTHSLLHHAVPHCTSHELYKGILDDTARGIFNGKIFVHPHAQLTDAIQNNAALLLSNDAKAYSEPQLEIYADDVKCTHGATVGQLDENQLFYLQARGIDEENARGLLTVAFAAQALTKLKVPALFEALDQMLLQRFSEG